MSIEVVTAAEDAGADVQKLGQVDADLSIDSGHGDFGPIDDQFMSPEQIGEVPRTPNASGM